MSQSQTQIKIGHLVPLNHNLKEDTSLPKLPVFCGSNVIGRNSLSVPDKRLSRKHLTLIASSDGSAHLVVEGTNPVVVNSGGERTRLNSREPASICNGDVLELIPGHYFLKYETQVSQIDSTSLNTHKRSSFDGRLGAEEREGRSHKRSQQQTFDYKSPARNFVSPSAVEAIRHFHVPRDKVPRTFRLLRVQGLPQWANTSCVSIGDVVQGDFFVAILSNYMVDLDWLLPACPTLSKVPNVLVIHGESDGRVDHLERSKPANWILHKPPLPISFGTHHSKAMLLVYPQGLRVIIHTANLIYVDWNNKSQGLWMQDFPWRDQNSTNKGSGFEDDLIEYLSTLKWPEFSVTLPRVGSFKINPSFFRKFDFRDAMVRLIASVPGYHNNNNMKKWGHMKLRAVLQECTSFDSKFKKSPLVYQFSSLGSLDEKWMAELTSSMSSGFAEDQAPLGIGEPRIIWPTVEDIRCSLEGYAAGNAVPSPLKNVEKEFLKKYWAKWKADNTGRCHAMPHIKTYARYNGQQLAWFLLTSANLSKAAWGALQKNNSQLMIRSYELGVLFLPSLIRSHSCAFSCLSNHNLSEDKCGTREQEFEGKGAKLVTLTWQTRENSQPPSETVTLPIPYELPPHPYSPEDVPWSWDRRYNKKDVYGQVWPRQVQLYASVD